MPNRKFRTVNRFRGKRRKSAPLKDITTVNNVSAPIGNTVIASDVDQGNLNIPTSSTADKLSKFIEKDYSTDKNSNSGSRIIEFKFLEDIIGSVSCSSCNGPLSLEETRFGLASEISITCQKCFDVKLFNTSHRIANENSPTTSFFEVNRLAVGAFREIGCGQAASQSWFSAMNIPISLSKSTFAVHSKAVSTASINASDDNLKEAVEIVRHSYAELLHTNDEIIDIAVAYDGTWHRRGHRSHYGVGIVTDLLTGLVIDFEIMCTYCFGCQAHAKEDKSSQKYQHWLSKHKCDKNFCGSANAMESAAALRIWKRSVEKNKLRYTTLLGDGDSKTHHDLLEAKPYGSITITKEECVNHVSKRMGTALKNLVAQCRAEGSPISGKGRLTQERILKLQNYYGKAIKDNNNNLEAMRNGVWAVLLHSISTDEEPHHTRCPSGETSWCWWQRDQATGNSPTRGHKNPLPKLVGEKLIPIFKRLGGEELLKRCLRGKTQNINESINSIIWQRCPKVRFAGLSTVKFAVSKGVSVFNKGALASLDIAEKMGTAITIHTVTAAERRNAERKRKSDIQATEKSKKARKVKKLQKTKLQDELQDKEGVTYEAGSF